MRQIITSIIEFFGACSSLIRLGVQTRFRFNGPYWIWRQETAFGNGEPEPTEKRRAVFHYARWVWRMGRHM